MCPQPETISGTPREAVTTGKISFPSYSGDLDAVRGRVMLHRMLAWFWILANTSPSCVPIKPSSWSGRDLYSSLISMSDVFCDPPNGVNYRGLHGKYKWVSYRSHHDCVNVALRYFTVNNRSSDCDCCEPRRKDSSVVAGF